jgi:hypothetical protein
MLGSRNAGSRLGLVFELSQFFAQARHFGAILCRLGMVLDGGDAAGRFEKLGDARLCLCMTCSSLTLRMSWSVILILVTEAHLKLHTRKVPPSLAIKGFTSCFASLS